MYAPASISAFVQRIGWNQPQTPAGIVLTADNAESTTGRLFASFHSMCIPYNVAMTMPESTTAVASAPTNDQINAFLAELKKQAALKVLNQVFDQNPLSQYRDNINGIRVDLSGSDYDTLIFAKPGLFDEAYGCQVALDTLSMMLMSTRSNSTERAVIDKGRIQAEIDGITDGLGNRRTIGIASKLQKAYDNLIAALFPSNKGRRILTDASNRW